MDNLNDCQTDSLPSLQWAQESIKYRSLLWLNSEFYVGQIWSTLAPLLPQSQISCKENKDNHYKLILEKILEACLVCSTIPLWHHFYVWDFCSDDMAAVSFHHKWMTVKVCETWQALLLCFLRPEALTQTKMVTRKESCLMVQLSSFCFYWVEVRESGKHLV